jgi:hypothetical protein
MRIDLKNLEQTKFGEEEKIMKKLMTICLVFVCVLSTVNTVLADDIYPPTWRGQPDTVTARWDSWTGYSYMMYPDAWNSNPGLSYLPSAYAYEGASFLPEFEGRTDVIKLTGNSQIDFWLPNFDQENPYKEVQIQVTYFATSTAQWSGVDASTFPYSAEVSEPVLITDYNHGDGWYTDVWDLQIRPNPPSEFIYVNFTDGFLGGQPLYPAYLDQVVIDTICVPEPATICLFGLGALSLIRRKK